ncbi:hypothetical protein ABFT23_06655 [Nocardioides sp. C4-1]|uniref:hypothetical protein n=1 Tax=Nocardioides sp. C4-1 TaxID=3151851 RepID=UPI0032652015
MSARTTVAAAAMVATCVVSAGCTDAAPPPPPHQFVPITEPLCDDLGLRDVARDAGWLRRPEPSLTDLGDADHVRQFCGLETSPGGRITTATIGVDVSVEPGRPRRTVDIYRCDDDAPDCDPGTDVDGWWDDGLQRARVEDTGAGPRRFFSLRTTVTYGNASVDVRVVFLADEAGELEPRAQAATTELLDRARVVLETRLAPES